MFVKNRPMLRTFVATLACFIAPLSAAYAADNLVVRDASETNEQIEDLVRQIWEKKWCPPNSLCLDPDENERLRLSGNHTYDWLVVPYGKGNFRIRASEDLVLVVHRVLLGGRRLSISGSADDGRDGADAARSGAAGGNGRDGDDGPNLKIQLGIVDASIAPKLGLPSFRDQLARIRISSDGGDGGHGGDGGSNGGDGGHGGDGGNIQVTVWRSAFAEEATHIGTEERNLLRKEIRAEGGEGGRGGTPGQGGQGGENGENGTPYVASVEFPELDVRTLQCEWEWWGQNQNSPQSSELRSKLGEECAQP